MSAFFKWLAENSIAGYGFIVIVGGIGLLVIISYAAALIQGRSISYWPPSIGERSPNSAPTDRAGKPSPILESIPADSIPQHIINIMWTSPTPDAELLLKKSQYSALILGTSLFRIVHSDLFVYREWLQADDKRLLALLFLNPFSPHAIGRERRDVRRSSAESILDSLRVAYVEARKNRQIIPVVYDGPFRYTARAVDIGSQFESPGSTISVVTSSHNQGISKGFHITLAKSSSSEPYAYYQRELIDLWMQSLANPSGHGISVVGHSDDLSDPHLIQRVLRCLSDGLTSRNCVAHLFEPHQLHITLSALCRTQVSPLFGPLTIGATNSLETLPAHFGQFVCQVINDSYDLFSREMNVSFNRIIVDSRGYIKLVADGDDIGRMTSPVTEFLRCVQASVGEYAAKYPDETWLARLNDDREQRFGPKTTDFLPQITLGMTFGLGQALPLPFKDRQFSIELDEPLAVRIRDYSVVHYAYRSLLRSVGSCSIERWRRAAPNELEVLQALGISIH